MFQHRFAAHLWAFAITSLCASAQNLVGTRDVDWVNSEGRGTPVLAARVHYPAMQSGPDTPGKPRLGGWPVVVFLHGYSLFGSDYGELGDGLAAAGYVAVMLDTAQFSYLDMQYDAMAMTSALVAANAEIGGPFAGMLDTERLALMGHSMGGAVTAYVLASTEDYRCALAVSPVDPGAITTLVRRPMGIVCGIGDTITPPQFNAHAMYSALAPNRGLKFLYEMDAACDHMNIVGLMGTDPSFFERTLAIAVGFFGQFLAERPDGLEKVVGPEALSEPHLHSFTQQVVTPQLWTETPLQVGQTTRVSVAIEPGYGGVLGASATSAVPLPTMFGELLLDPMSTFPMGNGNVTGQRFDLLVTVPPNPLLSGSHLALQGVGPALNSALTFGSAVSLKIN